jgi:hypothetical protein
MNFWEYVRVGIGVDPAGDTLMGSRASDMLPWHCTFHVRRQNGIWERTTGNTQEVPCENEIGPGFLYYEQVGLPPI